MIINQEGISEIENTNKKKGEDLLKRKNSQVVISSTVNYREIRSQTGRPNEAI